MCGQKKWRTILAATDNVAFIFFLNYLSCLMLFADNIHVSIMSMVNEFWQTFRTISSQMLRSHTILIFFLPFKFKFLAFRRIVDTAQSPLPHAVCQKGTFKAQIGDEACSPCPARSTTMYRGSIECRCEHGWYRADKGKCENRPSLFLRF